MQYNILKTFLLLSIAAATPSAFAEDNHDQHYEHRSQRRRAIVGGTDADPSRYPYYVRLEYDGEFGCGGSLIRSDFILTAAHCAFPSDLGSLDAIIGGHNYEDGTGVRRTVTGIFPFPAYDNRFSESNDIALLQIEPVPEGAPVVQYAEDRRFLQHGDPVTVIGMGLTSTDGDDSDVLQEVEVAVIDDEQCDDLYDDSIHRKSMICAGAPGKDSCSGDSGGPLIHLGDSPTDDVQVGLVSFGGEDCADHEEPGVYADVAFVKPWIDSVICQHSSNATEGCEVTFDSQIATDILGPDETCRDFAGAFYTGWWNQFQRCDWLREKGRVTLYCYESHEAWVQCPLSCHACTYETDDSFFDDDERPNNYTQSSSPVAMIFLLIFSCVLCCQCTCWIRLRLKRGRDASAEGQTDELKV